MSITVGKNTVVNVHDVTDIYLGEDKKCWNSNRENYKGYYKTITILDNENNKIEINLYSIEPVVKRIGDEDKSYEFDVLPVKDV